LLSTCVWRRLPLRDPLGHSLHVERRRRSRRQRRRWSPASARGRRRPRLNHFSNGAVWYFASEENRNAFAAAPETYAPAYDGYCSWAASQGYKAPGDPLVYAVEDGRLFLQVHPRAQELWQADASGHIAQGDGNWPRIHPF